MVDQSEIVVSIIINKDQAIEMENSLSDLICWLRGYNAGSEDGYDYDIYPLINLNGKLKEHLYKEK